MSDAAANDRADMISGTSRGRKPPALRRIASGLYRAVRGILALGMLVQILMVVTPLPEALQEWLDVSTDPVHADYIVCLGGRPTREIKAAMLYHQGFAPKVIVTSLPESAQAMRDLVAQCGVPMEDILVDDSSYTTGDHPYSVARLPGVDPVNQRFLIVTDREHSRRAAGCFRRAGYQYFTIHASRRFEDGPKDPAKLWRTRVLLLPYLTYEFAALAKYWIQGRM